MLGIYTQTKTELLVT